MTILLYLPNRSCRNIFSTEHYISVRYDFKMNLNKVQIYFGLKLDCLLYDQFWRKNKYVSNTISKKKNNRAICTLVCKLEMQTVKGLFQDEWMVAYLENLCIKNIQIVQPKYIDFLKFLILDTHGIFRNHLWKFKEDLIGICWQPSLFNGNWENLILWKYIIK